ncbi:MAG: hypothetical protein ABW019_10775 [Chitinophagaceae bacterium]
MFKQVLSIVIILLVLAGMVTIAIDLARHYNRKRRLAKPDLRWKMLLWIIGLVILIDKVQSLLEE